jgi:hypothetical protein
MAAPLSKDLRRRIVAAVEDGTLRRAAAARFSVSQSCAIRLMRRWQKTGSLAPAQMGGHRKALLHGHAAKVRDLVTSQPDMTPGLTRTKDAPRQRADPARRRRRARGLKTHQARRSQRR